MTVVRYAVGWVFIATISTLGLLLSLCVPAAASVVSQTTFDELCLEAGVIVEGRVVRMEAREDADSSFIWTHVTIEVTEVIHGELGAEPLELVYLGGSAGGRTLRISDMHLPEPGERGIYFVESLDRRQVHPLLGWEQGHFRIERGSDGIERVMAAGRRAVLGVEAVPPSQRGELSTGIAGGVETGPPDGKGAGRAMQALEFKNAIRDVLSRRKVPPR